MRFLLAVMMVVVPFVAGFVWSGPLGGGGDAGVATLIFACVLGLGTVLVVRGRRGVLLAGLVVVLAMVPVAAFATYCFSPIINPDAPCLR